MNEKESEKKEDRRMEELGESLKANGISDVQWNQFERVLITECYDSEAILNDLDDGDDDPFNLYSESNLFPIIQRNLFFAKIIKKHFGSKHVDDHKVPSFSFGKERLYHTDRYKDRPGYIGSPKYGSLKEECLQNRIYPMKMKQFAVFMFEAVIYRNSRKGRTLKAGDLGAD